MLMLLGSWAFECVYVANQDATIYIYIYISPWASKYFVVVLNQVATTF
jgi:hypothetical protein